jgi:hypothetical protein
MKILALEFSSSQRSVAIAGAHANCEAVETGGRGTGGLRIIEEVLGDAKLEREQIECLAVGLGPGSYTGIRSETSFIWRVTPSVRTSAAKPKRCELSRWRKFGSANVWAKF